MKQSDWQRAFGQPDQAFHRAFTETLEQLEEMNMKRRYRISTLLAAAVLLTLAFAGAALATVLSQMVGTGMGLYYNLRKNPEIRLSLSGLRPSKPVIARIYGVGIPSILLQTVSSLLIFGLNQILVTFSETATAVYGVYFKLQGFAFLPITSFTMACTTFVGQNLGARQYDRAKRGARFCIIIAVVMAELIGLCYYIWASQLISLFDSTPGVVALGVQQARTVALFYCLLAFSHSIAAVCRGAGRAVVPMMIMLSVWCVIRIIYIMLVVHFIGEIGYIYWAYPLTWAISSTIYLIYYLRSDWVHGFER